MLADAVEEKWDELVRRMANVRANTTSVDLEIVAEAILDIVYVLRLLGMDRPAPAREQPPDWLARNEARVSAIEHPAHYGGAGNPYEAILVIQALGFGFELGNCFKYIARAGKKDGANPVEDLEKARWYLDEEIRQWRAGNRGAW